MNRPRPRILLIKPVFPYPPDQGTKVVSFSLIRGLQKEFDVTVLARLLDRGEERYMGELERYCSRVIAILAPNKKSLLHRLFFKFYYQVKGLLLKRSLKRLYDCPGVLKKAARNLAREDFDLVIVEYWQLLDLIDLFPKEKTVLLTHDIDILVNREISLLERSLFKKIAAVRRWLLERKEEMEAYRKVRKVLALTERDKMAVELIAGESAAVEVLPFGVDVDYFAPPSIARNDGEILFLGALSASFNRDALIYFVTKIYPLVEDLDRLSVTVVGGYLPKEIEFFGLRKEVEVVGSTGDVRPYLHRASCMVVPLRYGGGLRIRILEAMAAGIPVICSTAAVAGIPLEAGRHYLRADSPEEFAEAIRSFVEDGEARRSIAEGAMEVVRERFSHRKAAAETVELMRKLSNI